MDESPEEIITKIAAVVAVLAIAGFVFWLFGSTVKFLINHLFLYVVIVGLVVGSFATYSIPHYVIPWWKTSFIPWLRNI
jgi:preprotein translocase subunit SecF